MGASYDKLWHLLIDRHMSKTQLIKEATSVPMQWLILEKMKMYELKC